MKSNLYALLPDDAEDATEGVVSRTTSTSVEKPKASSASSVASSTKTNKVKIPHVDALPVAEEEDTTLAEEEEKEKHSPHKLEKPHVPVAKKHGREFDRHSGTGRGKEISKGGAGGKYVFGSPEDEARKLSQGVNTALKSGMKDDEAVRSVEERIVSEVEGEEVEEEAGGEEEQTPEKGEQSPKETLTLDEYLAKQAEKKLQLANLLGNKPPKVRETSTVAVDDLKPWKREDDDDPTLSEIGQKNLQQQQQQNAVNNMNNRKDNKNKTVDMTKEFFREPPRRGRGGNSRGIGGNRRGGRGKTGPPNTSNNNYRREEGGIVEEARNDHRRAASRGFNAPPRRGFSSSRGGGGGRGGFRSNRITTPSISDPSDFPTLS
jgi:hypothetical protein